MKYTQVNENKVNLLNFHELKKNRLLEYKSYIEKNIKEILNDITYNKKILIIQIDSKHYLCDVVDIIIKLLNDKKYGYFDIYKVNESFFSDKLNIYIKFIDNEKFSNKYIPKLDGMIKNSVISNLNYFSMLFNIKYDAYNRKESLLRNFRILTDGKYNINIYYSLGLFYDDLMLVFR